MQKRLFTSESVTEGHSDKICDQISDAVLDALLEQDPTSRVACETAITTGLVLVMGEITTNAYVDIQKIVRDTIRGIGYDKSEYGFDANTGGVIVALDEQSKDIYMPYPISLAHKLTKQLTKVRKDGILNYLRPDGKSQVTVEYDDMGKPIHLKAVVLSTQHGEDVGIEQLRKDVKKYVLVPVLPQELIDEKTKFFINPTGRFVGSIE